MRGRFAMCNRCCVLDAHAIVYVLCIRLRTLVFSIWNLPLIRELEFWESIGSAFSMVLVTANLCSVLMLLLGYAIYPKSMISNLATSLVVLLPDPHLHHV